ncbi:MAG: V-type ATP synthase subunit D [Candidatus Edwardsbacteria bacterium]
METVNPTRMNLLARKAQIKLAQQGVDLLKKKRDALVSEFFAVVKETLKDREDLNRTCDEAYLTLNLAKAYEGVKILESASLPGRREILLEIDTKNLWGIKIPEVKGKTLKRTFFARGYNPFTVHPQIIEATLKFEELLERVIEVASTEVKLKKIGEEIKKTTRRVNALEQRVIPKIYWEMTYIRSVLEQREREDIFRLKRIKQKASTA